MFTEQPGARGGKPPRMEFWLSFAFGQKKQDHAGAACCAGRQSSQSSREHAGASPLGWNFGYLLPSGKRNKTTPVLPAALEGEVHRAAGEHEGASPLVRNLGYLLFRAKRK